MQERTPASTDRDRQHTPRERERSRPIRNPNTAREVDQDQDCEQERSEGRETILLQDDSTKVHRTTPFTPSPDDLHITIKAV